MPINHTKEAQRAAAMIKRWGIAAKLSRNGTLRDCVAATLDFTPAGKGLNLDEVSRFLVAAPLAVPPDHELDKLVFNGSVYQLTAPVKGPRPGGVPYYYDITVLYESAA